MLQVDHLAITLRATSTKLVCDAGFRLEAGGSLTILGQSGSGKTLTCKALMGILNYHKFDAAGQILFRNEDLLTLSPLRRRQLYGGEIAMIPQNPMTALDPSARIGTQMMETFRLHSKASRAEAKRYCRDALEKTGLSELDRIWRSYPHMLSGGMLQRVIIAMSIMTNARLIVADEPTTALDAEHKNATVDTLIGLRENGTGILLVTHDFAVAARLGGNILVMKDGAILESGRAADILESPSHHYTCQLIAATRLVREKEGGRVAC